MLGKHCEVSVFVPEEKLGQDSEAHEHGVLVVGTEKAQTSMLK